MGTRKKRPDADRLSTRPRVLIIDDDDGIADVLREALTDEGYAVASVPHGAAALELVKHHQPVIIVLDLRMPIMDGWSFAEQYRRQADPPAKLILISAMKDIEASAQRLGAVAYVRKPFDLDEIIATVDRHITAN